LAESGLIVYGRHLTNCGWSASDLAESRRSCRPKSLSGPVLTRSRFVRPFAPVAERRYHWEGPIGNSGGPAWRVLMPTVLPQYRQLVEALTPVMRGSPGVIVTIDGREGVGKTTLGRYLAWTFNVTLIETDLFLIPTRDYHLHLDDQINRIIERRITTPLPVIAEGIAILQLMKRIHRTPDFSIYLTRRGHAGSKLLERRLSVYEAEFSPAANASIAVEIGLQVP
jgi:hypothetical protein